jgi:hypothetical protein
MRHQAENVPPLIAHTGDVIQRAIGISRRRSPPLGIDITKQDLMVLAQPLQSCRVGVVTTLAVLDREFEQLSFFSLAGKRRVRFFDSKHYLLANKLKPGISHQRTRQQTRFTENLEAIADSQHQAALPSELENAAHDRRKTRHGAAAEIVAVRKSTGEHQAIEVAREIILMPEKLDLLTHVPFQSIKDVLVIAGARKNNYAPTHGLPLDLKPIILNDWIRQQFLAHLADAGLGGFT